MTAIYKIIDGDKILAAVTMDKETHIATLSALASLHQGKVELIEDELEKFPYVIKKK